MSEISSVIDFNRVVKSNLSQQSDVLEKLLVELWRAIEITGNNRHHFFNKGTNGRWRDVFAEEDLALYEMKVREKFSSDLAAWLSSGRLATGEP